MKRNLKQLLNLCLIISIVSLSIGFSYASESNLNKIKLNEFDEIKKIIESYFDSYHKSLLRQEIEAESLGNVIENGKFLDYSIGKAKYIIESHKLDNTKILGYNLLISYDKFNINNNEASIDLNLEKIIAYNYLSETFEDIEQHRIFLVKDKTGWLIANDISSNLFDMSYGINTDFGMMLENLRVEYELYNQLSGIESLEAERISEMLAITDEWDNYTSDKRQNAVSYAKMYTDDSATNNSSSYNNSQFKSYAIEGKDCQNYVSQCIWYGFGGRNSNKKDYPMNSIWWANTSGATNTWNWTGTLYFKNYITDNLRYDKYGIQGSESITPSNMDIGDYVYIPGHVMFISKIEGSGTTKWEDIYISAHTSNRKDKNLKSLYSGVSIPPSDMRFMKIWGIKNLPLS